MKILFLGGDHNPLSIACLQKLARQDDCEVILGVRRLAGGSVVRNLTKGARANGMSPLVKRVARAVQRRTQVQLRRLGLPMSQPRSLREVAVVHRLAQVDTLNINSRETADRLAAQNLDLIVVAAYHRILRRRVFETAPLGCLNVHPSLLPSYRGPNPFYWVLKNGETKTGVTIHFIDAGIDTGDIVLQRELPITPSDTEITLRDRSAPLAADMLTESVRLVAAGDPPRIRQDGAAASYYSFPPKGESLL